MGLIVCEVQFDDTYLIFDQLCSLGKMQSRQRFSKTLRTRVDVGYDVSLCISSKSVLKIKKKNVEEHVSVLEN